MKIESKEKSTMCWFVALLKKERKEYQPDEKRKEKIKNSVWKQLKDKGE